MTDITLDKKELEDEEKNAPKMKRAATKKRYITRPLAEIKPCSIYSSAADSLSMPSIDDMPDSDEEDFHAQPINKKKRQTRRNKKPIKVVYFDSDDDDIFCCGERTPTKTSSHISLDSPCSPPPPPDRSEAINGPLMHDRLTSEVLRGINVTLTNVRCVQNEFSSDDNFSPMSRTPGGSLSTIDIDAPQPVRIRKSITVKVRSRSGLHRFQLAMTEQFTGVIDGIAETESVSRDCVKLTRAGQDISESDTPLSINLHIADIIDCLIVDPGSLLTGQTVEVTIQGKEKNSNMTRTILRTDPLQRLMEEYSTFCGHPVTRLKFSFDGDVVKPSDTPEHLDFEEDLNTVDVHIFL